MDDRILMDRAWRGDEAAFLEVYRSYRDAIFRFAWRLTGAADAAEDIAHDCWVALLARKARWDPAQGPLRPFLLGTVRNLALRRMRGTARESAEVPEHVAAAADPLREVLALEIGVAVEQAVADLPVLQREALILFEYEELSLEEIAGIAGTEVGTIKARLHRARETLRRRLAPVRNGS